MLAKYILGGLAIAFLVLASVRLLRSGGRMEPAVKAWLWVGGIFALVSTWLAIHH